MLGQLRLLPVTQNRQPHVAERVPDDVLLARVATKLRDIERTTAFARTMAVGELILDQFFGGDPALWRERRRNKNNSIRRLAQRPDCPYGKSALNEAVGVFVCVQMLPCVLSFEHVSASHVAAVLRLPEAEREQMLKRAELGRWGVRQLRLEVVRLKRSVGERRGRPSGGSPQSRVAHLSSRVAEIEKAIAALTHGASPKHGTSAPDDATLSAIAQRLTRQANVLQRLCARSLLDAAPDSSALAPRAPR